jgi:diguanylate cyclase (GGDEF)-like protein/PAS domain S-box-containing protein
MSLILVVSILIRLVALGWSIVLLRQIRDWRMGFLSIMLGLMALQQILTFLNTHKSWSFVVTGQLIEYPGLIVSLMALISVYFLKHILSEHKQTNENLTKLTDQLLKNQKVLLELARENFLNLETSYERVVETDAEQLNISRVSIWLYNQDHTKIICQCLYQEGEIIDQGEVILSANQFPRYFEALEQSCTISANDAHNDPRTSEFSKDYLTPLGITSMMDVPIRLQGEMIGIVCHEHIGTMRAWSVQDADFATSIAEMCAMSIQIAERKHTEESLQESNERFSASFADANIGMALVSLDHSIIEANSAFCNMIGFSKGQITGISLKEITHPDDVDISQDYHHKLINNEIDNYNFEKRYLHKQGNDIWVLLNVSLVRDEKATPLYTIAQIQDISERKQAEEELQKLSRAVESSSSVVIMTNLDGEIEYVNPKFTEVTGYMKEEIIGEKPSILKSGETPESVYDDLWETIISGAEWKGEVHNRRKDGSLYWGRISISGVKDVHGKITHFIGIQEDVTHEHELAEQLGYQASHDALTGLINRREFGRRAERLLSTIRQDQTEHALCFMDLDQFKVINDDCGHTAGDEMLRQLSSLLMNKVRHRDTLARLGGDEFGVLMEHCALDDAQQVAVSLQKVVQDYQFSWEDRNFKVGVSIGLAPITYTTTDLSELLKDVEAACYMAKDKGRNRIHVYHAEDSEIAQRHGEMQWVGRVNQALEEDNFCLYAQLIAPLDGSIDEHYELLVRMLDEQGKIIPPGDFLPAAERYNLISKIDHWVVKKAFGLLADNPVFLKHINFCSINLSGQSITDNDFLGFIKTQLDESGIPGEKICFEITETSAISNLNLAMNFISTLKGLRCRFALDDFGSGLSSFGYLKNLPVDHLKIDGMFVKNIVDDPIDHAMVKSINEIGHVMGMQTIAEFVENDAIIDMLKEIGVNYGQGYGIGKPQPFDELLSNSDNVCDLKISKT